MTTSSLVWNVATWYATVIAVRVYEIVGGSKRSPGSFPLAQSSSLTQMSNEVASAGTDVTSSHEAGPERPPFTTGAQPPHTSGLQSVPLRRRTTIASGASGTREAARKRIVSPVSATRLQPATGNSDRDASPDERNFANDRPGASAPGSANGFLRSAGRNSGPEPQERPTSGDGTTGEPHAVKAALTKTSMLSTRLRNGLWASWRWPKGDTVSGAFLARTVTTEHSLGRRIWRCYAPDHFRSARRAMAGV